MENLKEKKSIDFGTDAKMILAPEDAIKGYTKVPNRVATLPDGQVLNIFIRPSKTDHTIGSDDEVIVIDSKGTVNPNRGLSFRVTETK